MDCILVHKLQLTVHLFTVPLNIPDLKMHYIEPLTLATEPPPAKEKMETQETLQ